MASVLLLTLLDGANAKHMLGGEDYMSLGYSRVFGHLLKPCSGRPILDVGGKVGLRLFEGNDVRRKSGRETRQRGH